MTPSTIEDLRSILGDRLELDPSRIEPYSHDESRALPAGTPLALVLAESTADVSAALSWANSTGVPVSIRGAGTGLVGGAVSYEGGLIVSLERMNQILEITPGDRLAVVQPGVITAHLDAAAREHGLFFPPDPASSHISSIGGNIATNAGGLRCIAHGVTADWVSGLTVVLADGRVMRTGARTRKNVVGYDLTRLFVGSEGTLGVVVEATVRLEVVPPGEPVTFWAEFNGLPEAGRAVTAITGSRDRPEVLELMDTLSVQAVEDYHPMGIRVPMGALLIGQTVGLDARSTADAIVASCLAHGAVSAAVAEDDALLDARRITNPALEAQGLKVSCDAGVPVSRLGEMFEGVAELSRQHGLAVATYAHAGDGNLHCRVGGPHDGSTREGASHDAEDLTAAEVLIDDITRLALSLGGTITGEHGIGSVKHHELPWQLDEVAIDVQLAIKRALDPRGTLTPGRAV